MNAAKDENSVSTLIAPLNTDGLTITRIQANPTNHGLKVNDGTTGSDFGPVNALKDDNDVSTLMAVSSADGITPVAVYVDASGMLLINSN